MCVSENVRIRKKDIFEKRLIGDKTVRIMRHGVNGPIIYWGVGVGSDTEAECKKVFEMVCEQCAGYAFSLAAFEAADWNHDFSPWTAPAVFGNTAFTGGASETLNWLSEQCLPAVEHELGAQEASQTENGSIGSPEYSEIKRFLAGYSLSGLFALWSIYETEMFKGAAACSASLWFPGWEQYVHMHEAPKGCSIYLSLGRKEEKTRNVHMAAIGDVTRAYDRWLQKDSHVKTSVMVWHEGGHFTEPEKRIAAGIAWLIKENDHVCSCNGDGKCL